MNETLFREWLRINDLRHTSQDSPENPPAYVWLDIETTGLDPKVDVMLEIGVIVTDKLGNVYSPPRAWYVDDITQKRTQALAGMSAFVQKMHEDSHLLAGLDCDSFVAQSIGTSQEIEDQIVDWITSIDAPKTLYGAGSTVGFDRFAFIQRYMPAVHEALHHRSVDNSTLKVLCEQHNPSLLKGLPESRKIHRAIPDLVDSIHEHQFYIDNFIWH